MEKILENNKLIAEFLSLIPHSLFPDELQAPDPFGWMATSVNINSDYAKEYSVFESFDKFFKFHSSWNWLIPVVKKCINEFYYYKDTYGDELQEQILFKLSQLEIEDVYEAVVTFIKWHNEQSNK